MAPVPPFKNQGFSNWLNNNGDMLLQSGLGLLSGKTGTEQAALGHLNLRGITGRGNKPETDAPAFFQSPHEPVK